MSDTPHTKVYDPVCGISLEPGESVVEKVVGGVSHALCSTECAERLVKDPARYQGEPLIRMRGVIKTFGTGEGATHVLRGVDFNVWEGDFISIVGASGSGKSTVLNLIGNLDHATGGEIWIRGRNITTFSDEERAMLRTKTFGFVFQQYNLIPWLTAFENTLLPAIFAGKGRAASEARLRDRLASLNMSHRLQYRPNQLSGGEQQRIALARALANDPEVILGDEPTGNLDSQTGKKILEILRELNVKDKKTLIIVTHDSSIAQQTDHIIALKDGRVVRNHLGQLGAYQH